MPIIYRAEKGTPLTSDEIDNNFKELNERLKALEDHPEQAEGLGKVHVQDDQITLIGTFGSDFGTFPLPKAALKPRGSWAPQTPYQKLDCVTIDHAFHCCLKDHTSAAWEGDRAFWQTLLSFPSPPSSFLPLYERGSLPQEEEVGKLALLFEEEGPNLIFFNGKTWQRLMKGETL